MAYNYMQDPVLFSQSQIVNHHHSHSLNLLPSLNHPAHQRHYSQNQIMNMIPLQNSLFPPVMENPCPIMAAPPMMLQQENSIHHQHVQVPPQMPPPQQQPPQQQVNGGVSHMLDYDVETMTRFVMKNAFFAFRTTMNQNEENNTLFHKGISSVLNATRLPSVTIYLAIDYLFKYISKLPEGPDSIGGNSINVVYQNTMIAFILANKFNDDKTFTNKSWSQATGMSIETINEYERDWLKVFEWKLYSDKFILYPEFVAAFKGFQEEGMQQAIQPQMQPRPTSTNNFLSSSMSNNSLECGYQTPLTMYSSPNSYFYQTGNGKAVSNQIDFGYNEIEQYQQNFIQPPMPLVSPLSDIGRVSSRDEFSDNSFDYDFYNFGASQSNNNNNNLFQLPAPAPQSNYVNFNMETGKNNIQQSFLQNNDLNQYKMMNNGYYKPTYNNNMNAFYPYSTVY